MTKEKRFLAKGVTLANIILAGGGILCFLALAYFVYYYGWTGQRQFSSWKGVLLYYVFPALMGTLLFTSLRLPLSRKINLALFLCTLSISVYALEIVVTVWFNLPSVMKGLDRELRADIAKALGVAFDTRSKRQVIEDLRRQGVEAVPSFPGPLLKLQNDATLKPAITINGVEVLPLRGPANKVVVVCNEGGQFLTYRSDELGFNNPGNLWDKRPVDIVAVGDSFVQGFCVPPDDNFVSLIRTRYPVTLNLGLEGIGPLDMLAAIKEYAQVVKPKVVLWFYFEANDISDLHSETRSPLLMRYLMDNRFTQDLFARRAEVDQAISDYLGTIKDKNEVLIKLEEISAVVRNLSQLPRGIGGIVGLGELRRRLGLIQGMEVKSFSEARPALIDQRAERIIPLVNLLHDVLVEAKQTVSQWGGTLYFVFLPEWDRYVPQREPNPDRDRVLSVAKKADLPIIDIHRSFMAQADPLALFPFRLSSHYNEKGHQVVAEEVLRFISALPAPA